MAPQGLLNWVLNNFNKSVTVGKSPVPTVMPTHTYPVSVLVSRIPQEVRLFAVGVSTGQ